MKPIRIPLPLAAWILAAIAPSPALPGGDSLWTIGREDGSNAEFAPLGEPNRYARLFPNGAEFTVGESNPAEDWCGVQPGPGDAWGGGSKPFAVIFDWEPGEPSPAALKIRLAGYHPNQPPGMTVAVNGEDPLVIHFPPGGHMDGWRDLSLGKPYGIDLPLPAGWLKPGANRIEIAPTACWLVWDSLALAKPDGSVPPPVEAGSVTFETLPFFPRNGGGPAMQCARLTYNALRPAETLALRLTLDGKTIEREIESRVIGAGSVDIEIPEVKSEQTARLEVLENGSAVIEREVALKPARKWTIAVVPQAHVDIGYTEVQDKAMAVHRGSNDLALELLPEYPEFVWSVESSYVMEEWLATRPKGAIEYFFQKARDNRIEVEAFYGNLLTGLLADEEAFRSLYYTKQLSREHGFAFGSATLTDAPSHIWSIPTVLGKSGVKYLSMGINTTRAPLLKTGLHKQSPIWWEGPDGTRVLAFFHDHYAGASAIGLAEGWSGGDGDDSALRTAEERIPGVLKSYDRPDYPYNSIHIHGAYGDNRPLTRQLPVTVREWNRKYEYPRIVFTTNTEWFSSFEEQYGPEIASVSGDGGAYWEDGAGSTALETAINRANQRDALLAETLLAGLRARGAIEHDYRDAFARIWHDIMLYNEHTWGAHNSVGEPERPEVIEQYKIKSEFALSAQQAVEPLLRIARRHLPGTEPDAPDEWPLRGNELEAGPYLIQFDFERGGIAGIRLRDTGRELTDPNAPWLLGQLVYARNAEPPYDLSTPEFTGYETCGNGVVLRWTHGMIPEVKLVLTVDTERMDARDGESGTIEMRYQMTKEYTYEKEGVYIAFPFAGEEPQIDYAVANAVVRAGRDWLPSSCKDWFTLQNWLRVRNDGLDTLFVAPDAPLINLQDINSNKWLEELPIRNGHVYAYVMNNYWFTNYRAAQGGEFAFRFVERLPKVCSATRQNFPLAF